VMADMIRVGQTIINLDNVLAVNLNWQDEEDPEHKRSKVVVEFVRAPRGKLDKGQHFREPYLKIFSGAEAEAIRRHLKKRCPNLLVEK